LGSGELEYITGRGIVKYIHQPRVLFFTPPGAYSLKIKAILLLKVCLV
jgi:hypothetical protein